MVLVLEMGLFQGTLPCGFQTVGVSVYCQPPVFLESSWDTARWLSYIIYKTKGNRRKSAGGENVLSDLWEAREAYHISRQGGGQSMKRVSYFTCCSCYFPWTRLPSPKRPSEMQPSISEVTLWVKMNGTPGEVIYFFLTRHIDLHLF